MTGQLSTKVYSLKDLNVDFGVGTMPASMLLFATLKTASISGIINAFSNGVIIKNNGSIFINISYLHTLLRTKPGAANIIWQNGIPGYATGRKAHNIDGDIYISGPDFIGLIDAKSQISTGKTKLYLQLVQQGYYAIVNLSEIANVRTAFYLEIERMRSSMKSARIKQKLITQCEFTGNDIVNRSDVEFAHIESVATNPDKALDVNNGVIILKAIHKELTKLDIHDFEGMYDFCVKNNYSTIWAENYRGQ